MISEYVYFDAEKFVKDYYRALKEVHRLEKQLDDMDYISAVETDRDIVQVPLGTSQTEGLALRRIAIQDKIDKYRRHIETCQKAFASLSEAERTVIEQFFTSKTKLAATVHLEELGYSRSYAYKLRTRALQIIADEVSGITKIGGGR